MPSTRERRRAAARFGARRYEPRAFVYATPVEDQSTSLILIVLALSAAGAMVYRTRRWRRKTNDLRAKLEAARLPIKPVTYDVREIETLPKPVQRYFRAVLKNGQPIVALAGFSHEGRFRMKESEDRWSRFTSTQVVTTRPPGFDWDARIRMAPGVSAFVHDAYVAGEGMLHAEALAVITVADLRGTAAADQAELLRYFAEAAWYPTALLPSQGVRWEATGDSTARASLTDGASTVSLEFRFDSEGLIISVSAASRYRGDVGGVPQFAPWHGRFWNYEVRDGMRIPLEAEVAWQLPTGLSPYWRGRVLEIRYDAAR